jgi:hypothetical protein
VPGLASHLNTATSNFTFTTGADVLAALPDLAAKHPSRLAAASGAAVASLKSHVTQKAIYVEKEAYYPVIDTAKACLSDTLISVTLSGVCDIKYGVSVSFTQSMEVTAVLDKDTGEVTLKVHGTPSFDKDTDIPWYDYVLGVLSSAVSSFVVESIEILDAALSADIERITGTAALGQTATSTVTWAGTNPFTITVGELEGAFYLEGNVST